LPSSRKSLVLSLRNAYEALAVSAPTVLDAVRGRLTQRDCDDRLERFAAHVMRNAQIAVSVRGREHLAGAQSSLGGTDAPGPRGSTYVVMSNHQSHYDVPVLYYVLGGRMRMVAKTELFAVPLFGQALKASGMIEVDRANRQRAIASLATAKQQLERGTHIWIAPEGTRSESGELLPFKKGGFVLALDMEAPILPITIKGTRDVLPSHGFLSRRDIEVHVTIHAPIETSPFKARSGASDPEPARVRESLSGGIGGVPRSWRDPEPARVRESLSGGIGGVPRSWRDPEPARVRESLSGGIGGVPRSWRDAKLARAELMNEVRTAIASAL
jgi:1-acyl-sn-glycerol-3-phosphate acyltransferase